MKTFLKNIKNIVLIINFCCFWCMQSNGDGYLGEQEKMNIVVQNNTGYEVIIDDLETLNIYGGSSVAGPDQDRVRKVFHNVGPFPAGKTTPDPLGSGNWAPGVGRQTEAHVIIVDKDGKRSDYKQGQIKLDGKNSHQSCQIEFDNNCFDVDIVVTDSKINQSSLIDELKMKVHFYKIIVTSKPAK